MLYVQIISCSFPGANVITGAQVTYGDHYMFTIQGDTSNMGVFQLFVDTDNNADTGYSNNNRARIQLISATQTVGK